MGVTDRFQAWVSRVVLARQDCTGGVPLCPFAAKALKDGQVHIEEMAYQPRDLGPILERVTWLARNPRVEVLILLHPGVPCGADHHLQLEADLKGPAAKLGQVTLGYHPDTPTYIGGARFDAPVCGLQFQTGARLAEARLQLLKGSYYDQWTVAQLKDVGFFDP